MQIFCGENGFFNKKTPFIMEKNARNWHYFCDLGNIFCVCAIFRRKRERRRMVLGGRDAIRAANPICLK